MPGETSDTSRASQAMISILFNSVCHKFSICHTQAKRQHSWPGATPLEEKKVDLKPDG